VHLYAFTKKHNIQHHVFFSERDKEDEACKLWNNIRGMGRAKHSVEDAINGYSHAMLKYALPHGLVLCVCASI